MEMIDFDNLSKDESATIIGNLPGAFYRLFDLEFDGDEPPTVISEGNTVRVMIGDKPIKLTPADARNLSDALLLSATYSEQHEEKDGPVQGE